MVDLEAGLVGNAYAISEGRGARMVIAGHIMELGRVEVDRENKLGKAKFLLVVAFVVGTGQSVRIWAEKCFRPGKINTGGQTWHHLFVTKQSPPFSADLRAAKAMRASSVQVSAVSGS